MVDNRTLIIGLDDLYRDSMAELEKSRLLECARVVSRELQVTAPLFACGARRAYQGSHRARGSARIVVLHADWLCLDDERSEYIWEVEEDLMHLTNRFIDTFNQSGGAALPHAHPDSAEAFYSAAADAQLLGRCVMLGAATPAGRYYHWAIAGQSADDMHVHEFWDDDLWTTARYTLEKLPRS